MKKRVSPVLAGDRARMRIFDIVNGFFNRCRDDAVSFSDLRICGEYVSTLYRYLAEIIYSAPMPRQRLPSGQPVFPVKPSAVDGGVDSQA